MMKSRIFLPARKRILSNTSEIKFDTMVREKNIYEFMPVQNAAPVLLMRNVLVLRIRSWSLTRNVIICKKERESD